MLRFKLKTWLTWRPQPVELLVLMHPIKPWPVQMEHYNRGIDNTHIDVYLSPRFIARAKALVRSMMYHDVAIHYWNEPVRPPRPAELEQFRDAYQELMDTAMARDEYLTPTDWMRLVQLAALKFLLQLVPAELQRLRHRLETAREDRHTKGRRLQYHHHLVLLAREESVVSYRVYRRLFRLVERLETTRLRRLRKSRLGISWPIPRECLFNALLHLPNLLAEEMVVHHYPMLCAEEEGKTYRDDLNRCIVEVFKEYLPTWVQPRRQDAGNDEENGTTRPLHIIDRLDQGGLRGFVETEIVLNQLVAEDEYKKPLYSWLDVPDNLAQFLDISRQNPHERRSVPPALHGRLKKHWQHFKQAIREELFQWIEHTDMVQGIVASYWTAQVCQTLPSSVSPRLVYEYLAGRQDRHRVLRRLEGAQDPGVTAAAKALDLATNEMRQLTRDGRREYIGRILVDFLSLRRDLKLAYKTFEAMDRLRICTDEEDITLSRINGSLYEFPLQDEQQGQQRIRCHTVLKADVRGSTRITSELRARKLNPATHFSQNFFNPLNALLADFGASKVFVEGDAVILSVLEYLGDGQRRLSVAYACGLALRILEVVARQNRLNRRHDLPDLELGLGIAFSDAEPNFLYDGDRQIMISPAINLADRLSSCAKALHDAPFARSGRPFRVEVLMPTEGSEATAGAKTNVLRYNVNGIEMDEPAFLKLNTEMVLRRVEAKVGMRTECFYTGRYQDRNRRMHWLVVRKSPLHIWERGQMSERQVPDQYFYEVVTDPFLITRVRAKLRLPREEAAPEDDTMPHFPL